MSEGSPNQTRTFTYDGVSRLTSENNPEWNNNVTTYIYDTDSSGACSGTYNGDLVKRTDAMSNVTCNAYDALHRVTGITYPSGPYAASTPTKTFVYDAAAVNGITLQNVKGRLAEAYTGAKTTDLGFSYDVLGRTVNYLESTPHSSGYYNVTASYYPNGVLQTLAGVGLPTITNNLEGMGRVSSVNASSGGNPVSVVTYNAASQVTGVTFGSSDPVSFGYDNNTGRPTEYKLTINGSAGFGDLTWNANGTLQQLAITDPFNASDVQTCTYSADDLARISSVNCLNGTTKRWNQNFTYDAFGNITKSVPTGGTGVNWNPGYDLSTNHYATGSGATYDANGNLTNDTFHTYTWNVDENPTTLDSTTLIYDALGREVEKQSGTTFTEFVFGPTGKLAIMNGQTQTKAFVRLPGGTQVKYAGNAISTYRLPDWLGSFRIGSNPNRTYSWGIAFAPFGEQYSTSGSPALSFTGEDGTADTTSDEYDFLARKLNPTQGRWLSPDPAGLSAVNPSAPQSWNRYAYVQNAPLTGIDPSGTQIRRPGHQSFAGGCGDLDGQDLGLGGCLGIDLNGFGLPPWANPLEFSDEFKLAFTPIYGPVYGFPDQPVTADSRTGYYSWGYVTVSIVDEEWYWGIIGYGVLPIGTPLFPDSPTESFCRVYGGCPKTSQSKEQDSAAVRQGKDPNIPEIHALHSLSEKLSACSMATNIRMGNGGSIPTSSGAPGDSLNNYPVKGDTIWGVREYTDPSTGDAMSNAGAYINTFADCMNHIR